MLGPTIRKELQLLRRDPRVIVRLLVLPVAFIALFGMAFKGGENKLQRRPLGAWCDPAGARCKPVLAALDGSGQFAVKMVASADEVRRAVDVAGGFLHADDARHFGQTQHGFDRHIGHRATRHVVQNDRQIHRLGHLAEVQVHPFLRRLVVVRHDLEGGIGAHLLGIGRQLDGLGRGVAAGTRNDGDALVGLLDRHADQLTVLFHRHGRRFAAGADDHDAVGAFGDVPVDEPPQRGIVDAAVFVHRRDERDDAASQLLQGGLFVGGR